MDAQNHKPTWLETLTVYLQPSILQVFLLGIASGLPLLLTASTLGSRLFDSGINIKTIGILASIGLPYSLKFLIAPLVDSIHLFGVKSHLAKRKSWCILMQALLAVSIFGMSLVDPAQNLQLLTLLAIATAIFSATQDIVIDALRIEILKKADQGAGTAANVIGYRIGMLFAGGGAFFIAHYVSWRAAYLTSAGLMLMCIFATLSIRHLHGIEEAQVEKAKMAENTADESSNNPEHSEQNAEAANAQSNDPTAQKPTHKSYKEFLYTAVIAPFTEFLKRPGAIVILLFIALFKLGDTMAGSLSNVFYQDTGFDKVDIGAIQKGIGLIATLAGTFVGGLLVKRMPILKALILCGILQILSNFVFIWLDHVGANRLVLTTCIIIENITGGMGSAAFVAYISQLCNAKFTATQYALLSSLSSLGRTLFASSAGYLQAVYGWSGFFAITALLGVPGMCLIYFVQKNLQETQENKSKALN